MSEHASRVPVRQTSKAPTAKVTAATLGGVVVTVVTLIANLAGVDLDPAVAAAVATIVVFVAGYIKKEISKKQPPSSPPTPPESLP